MSSSQLPLRKPVGLHKTDALRYENGRTICGTNIIVEWAKGTPRVGVRGDSHDECYKCHRPGHMARDCPGDRSYARAAPPRGRFREDRSRSRSFERRRSSSPPRGRYR